MELMTRVYIGIVLGLGITVLGYGLYHWAPEDLPRFFCYLVLAIPASALKVKLPGVTGTMSVVFVILIAAIVELTLPQALVIGTLCGVFQSYWHARVRPRLIQVVFSVAVLVLAVGMAYSVYALLGFLLTPFRLIIAASVLFATNTFPIAMIVALTEGQLIVTVWRKCYLWVFPYYLVGAGIMSAFSFTDHALDWKVGVIIVPIIYIIYRSYHVYMDQLETEQKHAQSEHEHANKIALLHEQTLEALNAQKRVAQLQTDFVSAVSHEFRSPLTTLRAITEMLAHDRISDEPTRCQSYILLEREVGRLQRLVEDLLDFGRMEAGKKQYSIRPCEIYRVVCMAIADVKESALAKGFQIDLDFTVQTAVVHADQEALRCALRNLLENAVKYSPECRTIWVDVTVNEHIVTISVRDQGIGIEADERDVVFQKFVRGAAAKKAGIKGSGIGLSMVREIIDAMGGQIRVESTPQAGSTFTILLPLANTGE